VLYQSSCGPAGSGRPEDCRSACRSSRLSFGVASAFHHPVASPIADTHSSTSRPVLRCVDGSQRLGKAKSSTQSPRRSSPNKRVVSHLLQRPQVRCYS
jgi:hypothetical protein